MAGFAGRLCSVARASYWRNAQSVRFDERDKSHAHMNDTAVSAPRFSCTLRRPASRYRFAIGASLLLLNISMGMSFLAVAPLFPLIINDFYIDRATASLLVGATSLVVALALVPGSIIAARLGAKTSLAFGGGLISVVALSPLADGFLALLATRLVFAIGSALVLGVTPTVVMRWFPENELPAVNGLNIFGQTLGVTFSMFMAPRLAEPLGWAGALSTFGCIALVATVIWLIVGRDPRVVPGTTVRRFAMSDLPMVLKDRATILLALGAAGGIGTFITFSSWLPTFYTEQFGYSLERAGSLAALLSFCAILGSLLGATLPARFPRRRPFLIAAGLLIPVAALGCFTSSSPVLLYPSVALFGIIGAVFMPVVFTIPMELPHMTPERVGVAVAAVLSVGNLSGFVAPLFVGFLRDQTGAFSLGLGVVALSGFSLALAGYLIPETGGRRTGLRLLDAAAGEPISADEMLSEQSSTAP